MSAHHTAIHRSSVSSPTKWLYDSGMICGSVLDYGCGTGTDVRWLRRKGFTTFGFDPYFCSFEQFRERRYDTVICQFVLNVIEDKNERDFVLNDIQSLLTKIGIAYVSIRADVDNLLGKTKRDTWQGYVPLSEPWMCIRKCPSYETYRLKMI